MREYNKQPRDRRLIALGVAVGAVSALLLLWPDDNAEHAVSAEALTRALSGNWVAGADQSGRPFRAWFGADGQITATISGGVARIRGQLTGADEDAGSWRVDADRLCITWGWWNEGGEVCYEVTRSGDLYRTFRGGQEDSRFRIEGS